MIDAKERVAPLVGGAPVSAVDTRSVLLLQREGAIVPRPQTGCDVTNELLSESCQNAVASVESFATITLQESPVSERGSVRAGGSRPKFLDESRPWIGQTDHTPTHAEDVKSTPLTCTKSRDHRHGIHPVQ